MPLATAPLSLSLSLSLSLCGQDDQMLVKVQMVGLKADGAKFLQENLSMIQEK